MKLGSSIAVAKDSCLTARQYLKAAKPIRVRSQNSPGARNRRAAADFSDLVGGISRKLEVRQPHALIHDLIRADIRRRFESLGAAARYIIVLIDAVAPHTHPASQYTVST